MDHPQHLRQIPRCLGNDGGFLMLFKIHGFSRFFLLGRKLYLIVVTVLEASKMGFYVGRQVICVSCENGDDAGSSRSCSAGTQPEVFKGEPLTQGLRYEIHMGSTQTGGIGSGCGIQILHHTCYIYSPIEWEASWSYELTFPATGQSENSF